MSLKAMSIVWSAGLPDRSIKLCALALADWCNDDGVSLHPSIKAVAERMSSSARTAQRTLHQMMDAGLLEVVGNINGGAPGSCRQYHLRLDRLVQLKTETDDTHVTRGMEETAEDAAFEEAFHAQTGDTGVTGDKTETGDTGDRDGCHLVHRRVTPVTETGDTGDTLSVIEPPKNRHRTVKTRDALPDWIPAEAWRGFLDMRKRQRKPPTERAQVLLLAQLGKLRDAGDDPVAVLDRSTTNSWSGLFPLPSENRRPQAQAPPTQGKYTATINALTGRSRQPSPETFDVAATEVHPRCVG